MNPQAKDRGGFGPHSPPLPPFFQYTLQYNVSNNKFENYFDCLHAVLKTT